MKLSGPIKSISYLKAYTAEVMRTLWGGGAVRKLPLILFVIAVGLAGFTAGAYVIKFQVFPYGLVHSAYKTAQVLVDTFVANNRGALRIVKGHFVTVAPDNVEAHRFEFITAQALTDPILVWGGMSQFAEYCPGHVGCLAVEYAGRGDVRHAYPYRPKAIEQAAIVYLTYEQPFWFSFQDHTSTTGISRYSNGDLLVVFQFHSSFPYAGGVARITRDGHPVWYRQDYSHHVPYLTDDDVALVPTMRIGEGPLVLNVTKEATIKLKCQKPNLDFVHVLDGDGQLLEEISILDAIIQFPYAGILENTKNCDPTHLNFVHRLGENALGPNGIGPGDLVVSLRNLNAFGILDRESRRLKKLVRLGFLKQHAVTHLTESKFLMLDNLGTDGVHGPSRLLMVDVADGTETTIFPNDATPKRLRGFFTHRQGMISISPDRRRAIVTFTQEGKAVEVRLADGAVLTVFTSLHDVSHVDHFTEERKRKAFRSKLSGVSYINRDKE